MSNDFDLVKFIQELLHNSDLRAYFAKDPSAALHEYGLDHLSASDVQQALVVVNNHDEDVDFSRHYGNDGHAPAAHGHESAAEYIQRVFTTNNYTTNHTTVLDQSINQKIDTHGGSFHQNIDNHSVNATGDGSVAAGGDISDSRIVTGDHNTVGDGNVKGDGNVVGQGNHAVTGDSNTTAFGQGSAGSTSVDGPVKIGDGASFNSGSGTTGINNSDHSQDNVGNNSSDHSTDHSNNAWNDSSQHGSHNDSSDHSNHSDYSQDHVGNDLSNHSDHSDHSILDSFNHLV